MRTSARTYTEMKNLSSEFVLIIFTLLYLFMLPTEANGYFLNPPTADSRQRGATFAEPEGDNVQRVAVGRQVKFKCVVNNIGDLKVCVYERRES